MTGYLIVAPAPQIRLHSIFQGRQASLFQPDRLEPTRRRLTNIGQSRATPQGEGIPKTGGRRLGVTLSQLGSRLGDPIFELHCVKLIVPNLQQIAPRPGQKPTGTVGAPNGPSDMEHAAPQRFDSTLGRFARPQLVKQAVYGNGAIGMEQQNHQKRPLTFAGHHHLTTGVDNLERPQDMELHRHLLGPTSRAPATPATAARSNSG